MRIHLILVAITQIQGQTRRDTPVVLHEEVKILRIHGQTAHAETLVEIAAIAASYSSRAAVAGGGRGYRRTEVRVINDEVVQAGVETVERGNGAAGIVELTAAEAEVVQNILNVIDVSADLNRV